jgi:putative membrane protein
VADTAPSGDPAVGEGSAAPLQASDASAASNTEMAAERTWLAWWRTALTATAGALGVGRLAPDLLQVAAWPYVVLGCGYAAVAIGLLIIGADRQRKLQRSLATGEQAPLSFALVAVFTLAGTLLAVMTAVLVLVQL